MSITQIIYEDDVNNSIYDTKNFRELNTWVSMNCEVDKQGSDFRSYILFDSELKSLKKDIEKSLATRISDMANALCSWYEREESDDTRLGIELDLEIESMGDKYVPFEMTLERLSDASYFYKIIRLYEAISTHLSKKSEAPLYYEFSV